MSTISIIINPPPTATLPLVAITETPISKDCFPFPSPTHIFFTCGLCHSTTHTQHHDVSKITCHKCGHFHDGYNGGWKCTACTYTCFTRKIECWSCGNRQSYSNQNTSSSTVSGGNLVGSCRKCGYPVNSSWGVPWWEAERFCAVIPKGMDAMVWCGFEKVVGLESPGLGELGREGGERERMEVPRTEREYLEGLKRWWEENGGGVVMEVF